MLSDTGSFRFHQVIRQKTAAEVKIGADTLEATPAFLHDLEARQGRPALSTFLESYAVLVPFLQQTAKQLLRRWLEVSGAAGRPVAATRLRSPREHNLLGRSTEQERIERLLDRARAGASDAMIIRGDAGLGKSTLLASAGERAQAMRVLRATGVESDAELPFSGLRELCAPLVDDVEMLPDEQATLVASASSFADAPTLETDSGVCSVQRPSRYRCRGGTAARHRRRCSLAGRGHDRTTLFRDRSGGRPGGRRRNATGIGAEGSAYGTSRVRCEVCSKRARRACSCPASSSGCSRLQPATP